MLWSADCAWAAGDETREKQEDGTVACSAAESHHTPELGAKWSEYAPMLSVRRIVKRGGGGGITSNLGSKTHTQSW